MTIDKVVSDNRCNQTDIIDDAIRWLERQKEDKYINKNVSVIIRLIDENKEL